MKKKKCKTKRTKHKFNQGGEIMGMVQGLAPLLNLAAPGLGTGVGMAAGMLGKGMQEDNTPSTYQPLTPASNKFGLAEGGNLPSKTEYQQMLKDKGYYKGEVDGIFGRQTGAAVRAFQKDYGLVEDGILGKNTSTALIKAAQEPAPRAAPRPQNRPSFEGSSPNTVARPRGASRSPKPQVVERNPNPVPSQKQPTTTLAPDVERGPMGIPMEFINPDNITQAGAQTKPQAPRNTTPLGPPSSAAQQMEEIVNQPATPQADVERGPMGIPMEFINSDNFSKESNATAEAPIKDVPRGPMGIPKEFINEQNYSVSKKMHNNDIQRVLKERGYYTGDIDGSIGPKSKKAIKDFQKANNLRVTGKVDTKTYEALTDKADPLTFTPKELKLRDELGLDNTDYKAKAGDPLPTIDAKGFTGDCYSYECTKWQSQISAYLSGVSTREYKEQYNAYGDAWERLSYLEDFGGKKKDPNDFNSFVVGDVVALQRRSFGPGDKATRAANDSKNPRAAGNQHVGVIIGKDKDGTPMIAHNFHGEVFVEPINKIRKKARYTPTAVIEPNKSSSSFMRTVKKMRSKSGLYQGGPLDEIIFGTKQKKVKGGKLKSYGKNSVKVKANKPKKKDSVELDTAFVDHGEVISKMGDGSTYVFPKSKINPLTGNTYAEDAEMLAKIDAKAEARAYDPEAKNTLKHNEQLRTKFASANEMENMQEDMMSNPMAMQQMGKPAFSPGGVMGDPTKPVSVGGVSGGTTVPRGQSWPQLPAQQSINTTPIDNLYSGYDLLQQADATGTKYIDDATENAFGFRLTEKLNETPPFYRWLGEQWNNLIGKPQPGSQGSDMIDYLQGFVNQPQGDQLNLPPASNPIISTLDLPSSPQERTLQAQEGAIQFNNSQPTGSGGSGGSTQTYTAPEGLPSDDMIRRFQMWHSNRPGSKGEIKIDGIYGPETDAAWAQDGEEFLADQKQRGIIRQPMATLKTRSGYSNDNPHQSMTAAENTLDNVGDEVLSNNAAARTGSGSGLNTTDPLGVGLQLAGLGMQGLSLLGGAEKQQLRLDNSQITRQQFDPRASLAAGQTAFNAARQQARNTTSRSAMMGNLQNLAANSARQQAGIVDRYNNLNAQAQTQYETRLNQREAQNLQRRYAVDDINARNRAAYDNGVRAMGHSIGNLGQARVAQTENRKSVDYLLNTFPLIQEHFLAQLDAQQAARRNNQNNTTTNGN